MKTRPTVVAAGVLFVAAALLPVAGPATAAAARSGSVGAARAQKAGVDASIQQVTGQLDQVDSQEVVLQQELDHAAAALATLNAQVTAFDARLTQVEGSLTAAQAVLDRASAALVSTEIRLGQVRVQEQEARARLKQDAVTAYMDQPGTAMASSILDLRSVNQLEAEMGYLQAVAAVNSRDADRFQLLAQQEADLRAQQQSAQTQALSERNAVSAQEASLTQARLNVVTARQAQNDASNSLAALQAALAAEKTKLEAQLSGLQQQSDQIATLIQQEEGAQSGSSYTGGQLSEPIPGAPITSPYGWRIDPILHVRSLHTGIDFGAPYGTPLHAAANGVVVAAGPEGGYGNATIIDHGGQIATLYGHQEQILVTVGQQVTRGQVIGLVGCTGWCTGPHVHFEVRVNGIPVDPAPYLGLS